MVFRLTMLIFATVVGVSINDAAAQPLTTAFTYQGELRTSGSLANGVYDFRFRLYDSLAGGAQVGSSQCVDNANVSNGGFAAQLDFGAQFAGQQRFIETDVRADTGQSCGNSTGFVTLTPRLPLTAVPQALFSLTAATATSSTQLNGQPASFYQNATNMTSGTLPDTRLGTNVGLLAGTQTITGAKTFSTAPVFSNATAPFSVSSTNRVVNLNADKLDGLDSTAFMLNSSPLSLTGSGAYILRGENSSTAQGASGVLGVSTAASGYNFGVMGSSTSPAGVGVRGENNATNGGYAILGVSYATTGASFGLEAHSLSDAGYGVHGIASATSGSTFGVYGETASTSGTGVYGVATPITGPTVGVKGETASQSGIGVLARATSEWSGGPSYGVYASCAGANSYGVFGWSSSAPGPGGGYSNGTGVWGESAGQTGRGVVGLATYLGGAATITTGVLGQSNGEWGVGIEGLSTAIHGRGTGVSGLALGTWNNSIGVVGETESTDPDSWGVFSFGNLGASGTKPFRIDHPDDPANTYLLHYAAESPEVINFYRGNVQLDDAGDAVVELPPYFAKINKSPSYVLTAVGSPMPMLHIATKIDEASLTAGNAMGPEEKGAVCWIRIAGGAPGGEVSWEVKAVRHDRWVQRVGAPVEMDKQDLRGTYQRPELYGQPPEKRERPRSAPVKSAARE